MPQSRPQWMALLSRADELLYGGAAGGGKTDLLLGLATEVHRKAIIFRREFPQLKDVIERGDQILHPLGVQFNFMRQMWRLPGRLVELGSVPHEHDKQKFKGRPHDLKAFDELPDLTESQFRFLNAWKRTTLPGQRVRTVCAGNPPMTPEGEWVIQYWAPWLDPQHPNPAKPGELRWYAVLDGKTQEVESGAPITYKGEEIYPYSRTFIPAVVTDNPFYVGTDYVATLQALEEPLRSILLKGIYGVELEDNPWQAIPTAWVKLAQARGKDQPQPDLALRAMAVDPSRGGDDDTAISRLYGEWFAPVITYEGRAIPDGPTAATKVVAAMETSAPIGVDVIGVGSSVYDVLVAQPGLKVKAINFAEASYALDKTRRFRFANIRAEAYWKFREALDPASSDHALALPDDRELLIDLTAPQFKVTVRGIQIEDKDAVKARIGRSPNKGDAVVMAWHTARTAKPIEIFDL